MITEVASTGYVHIRELGPAPYHMGTGDGVVD